MIGGFEWLVFISIAVLIIIIIFIIVYLLKRAQVAYPLPPCPNCNRVMQFVPQYQKWYCGGCNRYL
jgi:hypothetical protein